MARIFLLLAVVLGIVWWIRSRASARDEASRTNSAQQRQQAATEASTGDGAIEPMVQCAQCGVHLPRTDAIAWRGLHYCRRSHLPDSSAEGGA
ncbi:MULTISPECIES: PP0621 family protein [unclassified Cupriavidus]|uniref:PP0621 family protein n=1 Tax=unclassified Cupriavidus TaxID=2640874 RepID=UPI0010F8F941|nr:MULTISPECIES: PP0621 family protein [unclassified Cupriavidus]MWL88470.1 hypothetical protein [Cupriavidus sp. SW-Y-13]